MKIDSKLLDSLTAQAKESPRLRVAYDLRTTPEDNSQRILNAMEPGTVLPIHRHRGSTVVRQAHQPIVVILRGKLRQNFYCLTPDPSPEGEGRLVPTLVETLVIEPGTECVGFSVEVGRWPFDKLRNNEALEKEDVMEVRNLGI